jgi:hypothetical protein
MPVRPTLITAMLIIVAACACASLSPHAWAAVNVVVSHYGYLEPITETYYVVGEVKNVGETPVTNVTVTADFYDGSNTFINSSKAYILPGTSDFVNPWVLMPGAKAPFWPALLLNSSGSQLVDHYEVTVSFQECTSIPVGLQLTLETANIVDGILHVNGTVKNTGTSSASWVFVYATAYDVAGVAFGYNEWNEADLAPNQVATFDVTATNFIISGTPRQIHNYTVTAQSFTGSVLMWTAQYTVASDINAVIPEFPSALTVVLLMAAMTATSILCKRRQK